MGSHNKEDDRDGGEYYKLFRRIVKTWMACVGSFSISIIGGLILTWWECRYHPTNSQLWMVPFGLVLFITPVIVWLSVFVSDMFNPTTRDLNITSSSSPSLTSAAAALSSEGSFRDPER